MTIGYLGFTSAEADEVARTISRTVSTTQTEDELLAYEISDETNIQAKRQTV